MGSLEQQLLGRLFPKGLLDYFEITAVIDLPKGGCEVELTEKATVPSEFTSEGNFVCHGFYDSQLIQDFPLRGEKFNLRVKRRRWIDKQTQKIVARDWKVVAKGTSMSQEFATFLKDIHRF